MNLTQADIEAIAAAVVRQMRAAENASLDAEYLATLPIAEQKRLAREQMRAARKVTK